MDSIKALSNLLKQQTASQDAYPLLEEKLTKITLFVEPSEETIYGEDLLSLVISLYLLSINLIKEDAIYSLKTQKKTVAKLSALIDLTEALLTNPFDKKTYQCLQKLSNGHAFELRKHRSPWKYYPLAGLDFLINTVNSLRGFIFQTHFPRSLLANKNALSPVIASFLLNARLSFNGGPIELADLLVLVAEPAELPHPYLSPFIKKAYENFCSTHDCSSNVSIHELMRALNNFAKINASTRDRLHPYTQKAFLSSQNLVLELLRKKNPSFSEIRNLSFCLDQAVGLIEHPGDKKAAIKFENLIKRCDVHAVSCDKEKTTYAVLHIIASSCLLVLAVAESVLSHGVGLAVHIWTMIAEGSSLFVGFGQITYFSNSEVNSTLFARSMGNLLQLTRLRTVSEPQGADLSEKKHPREAGLLQEALRSLRTKIKKDESLVDTQAYKTWQSAEELSLDLLTASPLPVKKIQKLTATIRAIEGLLTDSTEADAQKLLQLLSKADYETTRLNCAKVFITAALALTSLVLFAVTIPSTIISGGMTAGTILSPIMLAFLALNQWSHRFIREPTLFTQEAKYLLEYSSIFAKPANLNRQPSQEIICNPG